MLKKLLVSIAIATYLVSTADSQPNPANPNANETTITIYRWLAGLNQRSVNRVISGQMMNSGLTPEVGFDSCIVRLQEQTGKWVGLIGMNYQRVSTGLPSGMHFSNQPLIDYFHAGGLVAAMCPFSNPWSNGFSGDTTGTSRYAEFYTEGTAANTEFRKRLDSVAAGLKELQDSGVTVLWRPFQEMNGTWFWWGSKNQPSVAPTAAEFRQGWLYMFNYFTYTKQLNNLLWVYAPSARESSVGNLNFKTEMYYYPDSTLVDIVGVDVYNDTLDIPNYNQIRSLGKPIAIAEFGPSTYAQRFSYDYRTLINQVRAKCPEFVYWMSWNDFTTQGGTVHKYYALQSGAYTTELLADSLVMTREEIDWQSLTYVKPLAAENPNAAYLAQNYPNPFNPTTTIRYYVPGDVHAALRVFDVLGRETVTLVEGIVGAGYHQIVLDGRALSSGVYFYRLTAAGFSTTKKLLIAK